VDNNKNFLAVIIFISLIVLVSTYKLIASPKTNITKSTKDTRSLSTLEQSFQQYAFTDDAPPHSLIYPKVLNTQDLYKHNQRIFVQRNFYPEAYGEIQLRNITQLDIKNNNIPIIKLNFSLKGKNYNAYAYGDIKECGNKNVSSALIIPGSGNNQSYGIFTNDSKNYHYGILKALDNIDNILVQIKPNQDARSWHNGSGKKINDEFIINWHLSMGGSYSISYLIESLALIKYIKSCDHKSILAGLSQGGMASLYVSLQSNPTIAIISSGYSILNEKVVWAGFNQIMGIPNSEVIATPDGFINLIKSSSTKFLFTWGKLEKLYYGDEANNKHTGKLLENVPNAFYKIHPLGHKFPFAEIKQFINDKL